MHEQPNENIFHGIDDKRGICSATHPPANDTSSTVSVPLQELEMINLPYFQGC